MEIVRLDEDGQIEWSNKLLLITEVSMLTLYKRKYVIFCDKERVFLGNKLLLITEVAR